MAEDFEELSKLSAKDLVRAIRLISKELYERLDKNSLVKKVGGQSPKETNQNLLAFWLASVFRE